MQAIELETLTQPHKVIVLQNVLCPVLRVEELSSQTSPHAELHLPASILELLGLTVAPQGLGAQRLDGGRGAAAGHPEPLAPNTHRHAAHRVV